MKRGKRYRALENLIDKNKLYSPREAISLVKKMGNTKFDETVELSVKLGVDPKRSDHQVRGSTPLPHGTGKKVRILAIAEGEAAKEAQEAGADFVGGKEMVKKIEEGWLDFDAVVAHPSFMRELGKVGKILGPRGLMPSPKTGTVSEKLAPVIKELKAGRVDFKMDKGGNLHIPIGKVSFDEKALEENLITVVRAILRAKPASSKGAYLQKVYLSTTMSPSIKVNPKELIEMAR
ncbi:50S ribosomal protein L1 [Candidatus Calescamantes bacterium]|nr:50S ribosomal protein L1 [Candidatus Calescamantes bacterium]